MSDSNQQMRKTLAKMRKNGAQQAMVDYLKAIAASMERCARELRQRAEDVAKEPVEREVSPSERFGWAVNEIENVTRNFSFGNTAVCLAARYEKAAAELQALQKKTND